MKRGVCYLILSFVFLCACSSSDESSKVPPLFKSSTPADRAENVSPSTTIEVVFDEVISLASAHGITVNNQSVTVSVSFTKLMIHLTLEPGQHYIVKIPAGAVINTFQVALQSDVVFEFWTSQPLGYEVKSTLVTPDASPEVIRLYEYMKEIYGVKTLSGTMANVSWNVNEAKWVFQHTGKYPAINGFDLIHLHHSPANWINYEDIGVIQDWWNKNGIVHLMWHWNVPVSENSESREFYTDKTTFDISRAVQAGTWENEIVMADLAKAAITLKKLRDANIPVLWRPLHEAAGRWFWWGAKGSEPCKTLWKIMFDYFQSEGINNLIWVWTVETNDDNWYPGDNYVDMIGRDIYNQQQASWNATHFESIRDVYPDRIISLSECGNVADMNAQWNAGAYWSFFMTWYDYKRTVTVLGSEFSSETHQYGNAEWWRNSLNNSAVLTRDELPNLK